MLSAEQIAACDQLIEDLAAKRNLPSPRKYLQSFFFLKTAWGFSSHHNLDDEPPDKRAFYAYRAELLSLCIDKYLADEEIDPLSFPDVRASHI